MFTTVSGYYVGRLSYGTAPEFALRTNKGETRIGCKGAAPAMRENDIICVVLWNNEVVSISNFGTGTEMQYRVVAPQGPYWREDITFLRAFYMALLVVLMICSAFFAGMLYNTSGFRDVSVPAILMMSVVTYAVFLLCVFHRAIVTQHNARITNEIHKRTIAASAESLSSN